VDVRHVLDLVGERPHVAVGALLLVDVEEELDGELHRSAARPLVSGRVEALDVVLLPGSALLEGVLLRVELDRRHVAGIEVLDLGLDERHESALLSWYLGWPSSSVWLSRPCARAR